MNQSKKLSIVIVLLLLLVLVISGIVYFVNANYHHDDTTQVDVDSTQAPSQHSSINELMKQRIDAYLVAHDIDPKNISYTYINVGDNNMINYHDNEERFAASTYKLTVNMLISDKLQDNNLSFDTLIPLKSYQVDEASAIYQKYGVGGKVAIKELMQASIVYSDNTASEMLVDTLGGWISYKQQLAKYAPGEIISDENYTTCAFQAQCMQYLDTHRDDYQLLLSLLNQSKPNSFATTYLEPNISYHKPGWYQQFNNDVSLINTKTPYVFAIYTSNINNYDHVLGEIGKIVYDTHNECYA